MSALSSARARVITLPRLHEGQWQAFWALQAHRFKALRCGRRFGKTEFAKAWIGQGLVQGEVCAWFAPQHMTSHEVHRDLTKMFEPFLESSSRTPPVVRLLNGGRLDFWPWRIRLLVAVGPCIPRGLEIAKRNGRNRLEFRDRKVAAQHAGKSYYGIQ